LVLTLEWVEANGHRLDAAHDGMEMLKTRSGEIDLDYQSPFGSRSGMGGD
jgi:hypothetical protein